jgi:DNA modification methylase
MKDGIELVKGDGVAWLERQTRHSLDGIYTDPPWGAGPAIRGQKEYKDLVSRMTRAAWWALKPGAKLIVWVGVNRLDGMLRSISRRFTYSGAVIIRAIPPYPYGRWMLGGDHVLVYGKGGYARPQVRLASGEMTLTSRYGNFSSTGVRVARDTSHPCPRDHRAAVVIARQWFKPGDHVVDPFGGSAVIACALADAGIRSTSIEIDPKMHRTAVDRVAHRTPNLFKEKERDHEKDQDYLLGLRPGTAAAKRSAQRPGRRPLRRRAPSGL